MTFAVGPGALAATGAGLLAQEPHPTAVESPLPGGIAAVIRFFFSVPQWIQIGGAVLGVIVAVVVVVTLWRRRTRIIAWLKSRPRQVKIALATGVALAAIGATSFGAVSWNYMQHDNGFCTGCHVMKPAFVRFSQSEHDSLSCHSCHTQSLFASMRQLYLWVQERPEAIGKHAKVPNAVCGQCHVTGQEKEKWQHIITTAGHRTHLESDSSVLKNLQCVTCHGLEVHHFAPVDSTCGQAGCHINVKIQLGKMQRQTSLHCVTCHQFTAEVPRLATRDSAAGTLRPNVEQCFSCHEMQRLLATFDPSRDPHQGTCGMCHNPHTQKTPQEAKGSCTTAGCHDDWRKEPFHTGVRHRNVAQQCTLCHLPHQARVDPSDCAGCHAAVNQRSRGRLHPPQAFDTTRALRSSLAPPPPPPPPPTPPRAETHKGKGDAPPFDDPPWTAIAPPPDSFPHDRHKSLACLTCHASSSGHGRLTFAPPRGCQICHHQGADTSACATCHSAEEVAAPRTVSVRVTVAGHEPRARDVGFRHDAHQTPRCVSCHATRVSLAPDSATVGCTACHDDHHQAGRSCGVCHSGDQASWRTAHAPPADAHAGCDACHASATIARLVPDRGLCLTCHAKQQDGHYADRECTTCHFQAGPDAYRAHLRKAGS